MKGIREIKAYLKEHPEQIAVVSNDYDLVRLSRHGIPLVSLGRLLCIPVGSLYFLTADEYRWFRHTEETLLYGQRVRGQLLHQRTMAQGEGGIHQAPAVD